MSTATMAEPLAPSDAKQWPRLQRIPMFPDSAPDHPRVSMIIPDSGHTEGVELQSEPLPHLPTVRIVGFIANVTSTRLREEARRELGLFRDPTAAKGLVQGLQIDGDEPVELFLFGEHPADADTYSDRRPQRLLRANPILRHPHRARVTVSATGTPGETVVLTASLLVEVLEDDATDAEPNLWSRLRYCYEGHEPQPAPTPARAQRLTLLLDDREVWTGDVTEQLSAWARFCALKVADLWDCPDVVRRYLQTGDEALRAEAVDAVGWACRATRGALEEDVTWRTAQNAAKSATLYHPTVDQRAARNTQAAHLLNLLLRRVLPSHLHPLLDDEAHESVLADAFLERTHG